LREEGRGPSNEIGEAGAGKTAAHDLLLKLEKIFGPHFQVWSPDDVNACGEPPDKSGSGDPYPPVPPA